MGISAVDELLAQELFDKKPTRGRPRPPRIHVPFIVYEVNLFLLSWIGLIFFSDEPRVRCGLNLFFPNDAGFVRIQISENFLSIWVLIVIIGKFFYLLKVSILKDFGGSNTCGFSA